MCSRLCTATTAIPLLSLQPDSNYTAHCAVKELESWDR